METSRVPTLSILCLGVLSDLAWGPQAVLSVLGVATAKHLWDAQRTKNAISNHLIEALSAVPGDSNPLPRALQLRTCATNASLARARLLPLLSLHASECSKLTDGSAFASLTGLTQLDISKCTALSDSALRRLGALTNLSRLSLASTLCSSVDWLSPLSALSALSLARTRVTDAALAQLPPLPALTGLDLSGLTLGGSCALVLTSSLPALLLIDVTGVPALAATPLFNAFLDTLRNAAQTRSLLVSAQLRRVVHHSPSEPPSAVLSRIGALHSSSKDHHTCLSASSPHRELMEAFVAPPQNLLHSSLSFTSTTSISPIAAPPLSPTAFLLARRLTAPSPPQPPLRPADTSQQQHQQQQQHSSSPLSVASLLVPTLAHTESSLPSTLHQQPSVAAPPPPPPTDPYVLSDAIDALLYERSSPLASSSSHHRKRAIDNSGQQQRGAEESESFTGASDSTSNSNSSALWHQRKKQRQRGGAVMRWSAEEDAALIERAPEAMRSGWASVLTTPPFLTCRTANALATRYRLLYQSDNNNNLRLIPTAATRTRSPCTTPTKRSSVPIALPQKMSLSRQFATISEALLKPRRSPSKPKLSSPPPTKPLTVSNTPPSAPPFHQSVSPSSPSSFYQSPTIATPKRAFSPLCSPHGATSPITYSKRLSPSTISPIPSSPTHQMPSLASPVKRSSPLPSLAPSPPKPLTMPPSQPSSAIHTPPVFRPIRPPPSLPYGSLNPPQCFSPLHPPFPPSRPSSVTSPLPSLHLSLAALAAAAALQSSSPPPRLPSSPSLIARLPIIPQHPSITAPLPSPQAPVVASPQSRKRFLNVPEVPRRMQLSSGKRKRHSGKKDDTEDDESLTCQWEK